MKAKIKTVRQLSYPICGVDYLAAGRTFTNAVRLTAAILQKFHHTFEQGVLLISSVVAKKVASGPGVIFRREQTIGRKTLWPMSTASGYCT